MKPSKAVAVIAGLCAALLTGCQTFGPQHDGEALQPATPETADAMPETVSTVAGLGASDMLGGAMFDRHVAFLHARALQGDSHRTGPAHFEEASASVPVPLD